MRKGLLLIMAWLCISVVWGQGFNNNSQKSYINIAMPKTPESQSFEKYGNIPLDEYSGSASISIPIGSVQGKFLNAPVSVSYHASGIKVNQEATWVGLGFDLIAGGRITVETKGNVDDIVKNLTNQSQFKDGLRRIFNKWRAVYRPAPKSPQLGYAFLDYCKYYGNSFNNEYTCHMNDTLWDDYNTIGAAAWYGAGEPDIYHASFLGQSINFYVDLLDGSVKTIGEKSLFAVSVIRDVNGDISYFIIKDNAGVAYYFEQKERTKVSVTPNFAFLSSVESTSAWLLTKVIHPSGDQLTFTYTNYGKTYPAFSWSSSYSCVLPYAGSNPSSDQPNQVEQDPFYLSRIESSTSTIDFIVSARDDIRGPGARKLDRIEIKDKISGDLLRSWTFNYDYFTTPLEPYENSLAESIRSYYGKRLRLLSVQDNTVAGNNPWVFSYNPMTGPSKLSFSQDHWGYYNGVANAIGGTYPAATSPLRLIPSFNSLGSLATRSIGAIAYGAVATYSGNALIAPSIDYTIPTGLDGTADRNCYPAFTQAFMLTGVTYPTGGSSTFEYEVHRSVYQGKSIPELVGGGLRVKAIKNYSYAGKLESSTEYDYMNSGVYLGAIEYIRITNRWPSGTTITMSNSGDLNADKQAVGYAQVKKTVKDYLNQANNGYSISYYKAEQPQPIVYSQVIHPFAPLTYSGLNCGTTDKNFLLMKWSANPPTPNNDLDGKMIKQELFDAAGVKVKYAEYYYKQSQQSDNYYALRVADNYDGRQGQIGFLHPGQTNYYDWGKGYDFSCNIKWLRWETCLVPNVNYFTVLDSAVDYTLADNGNYIRERKSYKYNAFAQPEFTSVLNSDGTEALTFTQTPLSFPRPVVPSQGEADGYTINQMKQNNMVEYPIEQTMLRRTAAGDTLVTGSVYNRYDGGSIISARIIEPQNPLAWRTDFKPAFMYSNYPAYSSFNIITDSRYKLQDTAIYTASRLIKDLITSRGRKAFIWDETNNAMMASCTEAASDDIAFTSFESAATGGWSYAGTPIADQTSPTGNKLYSLATGTVYRLNMDAAKTFILSYWSKAGATVNIAGATVLSTKDVRTIGVWTCRELRISGVSSLTITGNGYIDELRLYPENAQMTTYTFKPSVGISGQCDAANKMLFYEYDAAGRMVLVRDMDRNIVKKVCYNYAGQLVDCSLPYTSPVGCDASNCTGINKKCVNGICETGVRYNLMSVSTRGGWVCYFVYRWSDSTESPQYTEINASPCSITAD